MANPIAHIRRPMPPKRGNSFYRDKTDYSKYVLSFCGAPVTDRDVDLRTFRTKRFQTSSWINDCCGACREKARS